MAIESGRLKHRVTLQNPVQTVDADGGVVFTYSGEFARPWMEIVPRLGNDEVTISMAERGRSIYNCKMRYIPGVDVKTRILWDSKVLDVIHVSDPTGKRRELQLIATHGETSG